MDEYQKADVKTRGRGGPIGTAASVLIGLTSSHAVFHFVTQSFLVMLPEVKAAFGLTPIQVGAINSTRELTSGIVMLPGGLLADLMRRYWGWLLALCMAGFGLGWLVVGLSPIYPLLLTGMALVAMASSLWHLPAAASLSHHFSHRRGAALSVHGIGGSIGDVLGPVITGFLLGILAWRGVLSAYAVAPLFLAFVVLWAFRGIGRGHGSTPRKADLRGHIQLARRVLKNPSLWGINLVAGLRGMTYVAFTTFLPLYLRDELGLSSQAVGLHIGLLVLVGVIATPVMGYLSDRLGRKPVLIPGLLVLSALTVLLVTFGQGVMLALLIGLLGLFLYSDQPILMAAALDIVGRDVVTTTLGVLSFSRFTLSAVSPIIAGILYQTRGAEATFYYVAGLFALAAVTLLAVRLKPSSPAADLAL